MSLEDAGVIDFVGIENDSGMVILTIADAWDWEDVHAHLLALQAKLNAYFRFVGEGELLEAYPQAAGRRVAIDVITKYPMHPQGAELLGLAANACRSFEFEVEIRTRNVVSDS